MACAHTRDRRLGLPRLTHVARRGLPSKQDGKTLPAEVFCFLKVTGMSSLAPHALPLPSSAPRGHQHAAQSRHNYAVERILMSRLYSLSIFTESDESQRGQIRCGEQVLTCRCLPLLQDSRHVRMQRIGKTAVDQNYSSSCQISSGLLLGKVVCLK